MRKFLLGALLTVLFTGSSFAWSVNVFWNANSEPDVTTYNVYRATASGAYGAPLASVPATAFPTYSDQGLATGSGPFFYVVTAVNNASLESPFSNEGKAVEPAAGTAPAAPIITIIIAQSP